jgi:hypothetical protein
MQRRLALFGIASLFSGPSLALYDPKPVEWLSAVQGEWRGSLTYRDYGEPKKMVTLPTRLFVALGSPTELVLHYIFDDGPGKTVYSYERMNFDLSHRQVNWLSGGDGKAIAHSVVSQTASGDMRTIVFETQGEKELKRYTLETSTRSMRLGEEEVSSAGVAMFRNRYEFSRVGT